MEYISEIRCPRCLSYISVVRFSGQIALKLHNALTYPNPTDGGICPGYKCGAKIPWEEIKDAILAQEGGE